jgi:hypothetical protein
MPVSVAESNKHWGPCHKPVPAVVVECVQAAILAAFLRHLGAGFVRVPGDRQEPGVNPASITRNLRRGDVSD